MSRLPLAAALLVCAHVLAAPLTAPLAAQASPATLVVQDGGREIGREEFTLSRTPAADGKGDAVALTIVARYPNVAPATQLNATVNFGGGSLQKFVLEGRTAEGPTRVLAAGAGARLILKTLIKGTETGREMPGGDNLVPLDDNLYALFALVPDLATAGGTSLTAVYPRTGRRTSFTARRNGARIELSGGISGTITLDPQGRMQRLELPGSGIVATRQDR